MKVGHGSAGPQAIDPSWSWFNPFSIGDFSAFVRGLILMLFIYWGWDSAVAVNEETADPEKTPGRAAVISTVLLLVTYALLTLSSQAFAGTGTTGIGLNNQHNSSDIFGALGRAVFGGGAYGSIMVHLLLFLVLTSAAASTQTTILPTARTSLSMAVYRAIPSAFARVHKRYLTPTVSTLAFGGVSIVLYALLNYTSDASNVIADCVTSLGMMIAFYYGLTGFACAWYYRHNLTSSPRNFVFQGLMPFIGGVILFGILIWSFHDDWLSPLKDGSASYTGWQLSFPPHWHIGGVFLLGVGTFLIGVILMFVYRAIAPAFFRGETLNSDTPTLVRDDAPIEDVVPLA